MISKVIHLPAEASPNVRLALVELCPGNPPTCYDDWQGRLAQGERFNEPSGRALVPVLLSWADYCQRERTWDSQRKLIGLRARFPGADQVLLFPETWLERSALYHTQVSMALGRKRQAKAMGIDAGEGSANTSWAVGDEHGLIQLHSRKTPNTAVIPDLTIEIGREAGIPPERWVFDRGGGGKQHADRLRQRGYPVQTVMFGEAIQLDLKRGLTLIEERREQREEKSIFKNRRVEMYWHLASKGQPTFDAHGDPTGGFGIPGPEHGEAYGRLRRQLAPIPRLYDAEGRAFMPDKQEMIAQLYNNEGSPDEADAVVLMVYGLTHKSRRATAGAV